jgi:hypothetical protein
MRPPPPSGRSQLSVLKGLAVESGEGIDDAPLQPPEIRQNRRGVHGD